MTARQIPALLLLLTPAPEGRPAPSAAPASAVKAWEQDVVIPTYLAGPPEPNPIFFFGRASQGAEGRVYPYPLYDRLTHRKADKTYRIVYLENEYLRLGILPEIGGRLFEAVDKTNNYPFVYRQHVIKPALIGLIGAWISGGIEWNIPHHHRATTFLPVQYRIEADAGGGKTVWVGELELRHRMRWAVGYTLRPGRAYLEARVRILNRTPLVHTMLCFANIAVHANENYQVIFPPRTQWGTHHHKREFVAWPVARGRYGGADFDGVDVSWYKNHIASNSIFAWNYEDDFLAGYDHGKQAGTLSVADHHIVPGKKLWTWGTGPRGRMWDKILTDEDGPYVELMVGAYSDNQPDYSWLQPFETKAFSIYLYPFREIGGVKNANREAAVNLEVSGGRVRLGFCATREHRAAVVSLRAAGKTLLEETVSIGPARPYLKQVALPPGLEEGALRASLSAGGRELVTYSPVRPAPSPMPEPVQPPAPPGELKTNEELYLTGLRIEQFHHPTLDPDPYWEEALRRDPGDVRVNTALGINYLKKARFAEAERLFRRALERATYNYTTPKDGEAIYYLGLALKAQGRKQEAFRQCYLATWSLAWRAAGYYCLAEIAAGEDPAAALDFAHRSLEANALNVRALGLKAALLRHLGRRQEALAVIPAALRSTDPLDVRLWAERWLASSDPAAEKELAAVFRAHPATAVETAAEYLNAGLWADGAAVLSRAAAAQGPATSPLVYYYLAYFAEKTGQSSKAAEYRALARKMSPEYVFPFQQEAIEVLAAAIERDPSDPRAPYYLGNLLYDWQPQRALKLWEQAAALEDSFPIVQRNLAVAYSRAASGSDLKRAIAHLEKAVAAPRKYALHFAELDALYEAAGAAPETRLAMLERHHDVVSERDDALAREIALKVVLGKYDEAIRLMTGRRFAVWEGGSINVADDWTDAHLLRGHSRLEAGRYREALADYQAALAVPDNLPAERRFGGSREAEVAYWIGCAQEALGEREQAERSWQKAAAAGGARFRTPPGAGGQAYYQARALEKLGRREEARAVFQELVRAGEQALRQAPAEIDFFASFGEQQSQRSRLAGAHYLAGLGRLGLGERQKAREEFLEALRFSPDHLGARTQLARLGR